MFAVCVKKSARKRIYVPGQSWVKDDRHEFYVSIKERGIWVTKEEAQRMITEPSIEVIVEVSRYQRKSELKKWLDGQGIPHGMECIGEARLQQLWNAAQKAERERLVRQRTEQENEMAFDDIPEDIERSYPCNCGGEITERKDGSGRWVCDTCDWESALIYPASTKPMREKQLPPNDQWCVGCSPDDCPGGCDAQRA